MRKELLKFVHKEMVEGKEVIKYLTVFVTHTGIRITKDELKDLSLIVYGKEDSDLLNLNFTSDKVIRIMKNFRYEKRKFMDKYSLAKIVFNQVLFEYRLPLEGREYGLRDDRELVFFNKKEILTFNNFLGDKVDKGI